MEKDFKEYLASKIALLKMVAQFYNIDISVEKANMLGIEYKEKEIKNNKLDCVYHEFLPEGKYIWKVLGFKEPIITYHKLWNNKDNILKEKYDKNKNYHELFLRNILVLSTMIENFYNYSITVEEAENKNIEFDYDLDNINGYVNVCFHQFEGAGEYAWKLLELDNPIVSIKTIRCIEKQIKDELLNISINKTKKLKLNK